jgi:uncharacterized small protein (DUF1192 family)
MDEALAAIAALGENLGGRMSVLESQVSILLTNVAGLRRDLEILRGDQTRTLVDVTACTDRLQEALTMQGEDDIVQLCVAERAERIALSAGEEDRLTAETVASLGRQVRTLRARVNELRGGPPEANDA